MCLRNQAWECIYKMHFPRPYSDMHMWAPMDSDEVRNPPFSQTPREFSHVVRDMASES